MNDNYSPRPRLPWVPFLLAEEALGTSFYHCVYDEPGQAGVCLLVAWGSIALYIYEVISQ